MGLTDSDESVSLDTTAFALHSMHLAVCISAFLFNILLLYLLTRITVFHDHMKIIMINLTLAVIAAVFYLLIRSTIGLYQTYQKQHTDYSPSSVDDFSFSPNCAFSESVPQSLCILFFLFPMLLVTERSYATRNFWEYENNHVPALIGITCGLLWIPTIFENLAFLINFSMPESLERCQYSMLHKTYLQRNIYFIIVAGFCLIFSIMFKLLELKNKHAEFDFVTNNYSTISIRYQLRENIKTCRFAVSLNVLFFVSFLIFFYFDQNIDNDGELNARSAEKREYLFLIFPMFALSYAIYFITSHKHLFENAKKTIKELASMHNFAEQEKMLLP